MTDAAAAPPAAAPTPEEKKAKRNGAIARWGSIIVGVAAVIRLAMFFVPHGLEACDASSVRSAMKDGIEKASGVKVTSMTNFLTVSRADKTAACSVQVKGSDGSQALVAYQLDLVDGETRFKVTKVN